MNQYTIQKNPHWLCAAEILSLIKKKLYISVTHQHSSSFTTPSAFPYTLLPLPSSLTPRFGT